MPPPNYNPVHVLVSKSYEGDRVIYSYRILNESSDLVGLAMGWDAAWQHAELSLPSDSLEFESPWDWACETKYSSDGERGYLLWKDLNGYNPIPSRGEVACFSVSLPAEDPKLERCHWAAYFNLEATPISGAVIADTERPPVQVLVTKKERANGVEYRYRVVNGSMYPITSVTIGEDDACAPSGELFVIDTFPPGTGKAPAGWTFTPMRTEEDSMGFVQWEIDSQSEELPGGRELSSLSVTVPVEDPAFEHGHWMATLNSGRRTTYVGTLEPGGDARVPPSSVFGSDVQLMPQNGKLSITFPVPAAGFTHMSLLDSKGRGVATIFSRPLPAGDNTFIWDGMSTPLGEGSNVPNRNIPSGNYVLHIETPISERFVRFKWSP